MCDWLIIGMWSSCWGFAGKDNCFVHDIFLLAEISALAVGVLAVPFQGRCQGGVKPALARGLGLLEMRLRPDLRPGRQVGVRMLIRLRAFGRCTGFSRTSHARDVNESSFLIKGQVWPDQSAICLGGSRYGSSMGAVREYCPNNQKPPENLCNLMLFMV